MSLPTTAPASNAEPRHGRPPRVDRESHVEALGQGLNGGHHPLQLLLLIDLRARAGLHAADVEDVRSFADELLGASEERVEVPERSAIEERVRRAVEDAHDQRAVGDVVADVSEAQVHAADGRRDGGPLLGAQEAAIARRTLKSAERIPSGSSTGAGSRMSISTRTTPGSVHFC